MARRQIKLVVTPALYDKLAEKAKLEQLPISTYVRNLIINSPEFNGESRPVQANETVSNDPIHAGAELGDLRAQLNELKTMLLEQSAAIALAQSINQSVTPSTRPVAAATQTPEEGFSADPEVLSLADILQGANVSSAVNQSGSQQARSQTTSQQATSNEAATSEQGRVQTSGKNITINLNL